MVALIEKARTSDIPVLVELMAEFYAESNCALERSWAADSFTKLMQTPDRGAAWIGRDGAELAGYVALTMKHSMEFGGLDAFIDDHFVRPNVRRRGVATLLLGALFNECREAMRSNYVFERAAKHRGPRLSRHSGPCEAAQSDRWP